MAHPRSAVVGVLVTLGLVLALVVALVLATGCSGKQELLSYCLNDGAQCPPCTTHDECVVVSNSCHETASCTHVDTNLAVNMIGCSDALAYEVPSDDECACLEGVCRAR